MRKRRIGFTLIEVSLFLAVTGVLFLGVTIGVQNSIYQQRYSDAVQSFADFLGNLYSEVTNVQGIYGGRSDYAIYGKMVTFGETVEGEDSDKQTIYTYDVIGRAANSANIGNGGTLELLRQLDANVVLKEGEEYKMAGLIADYIPKWSTRIQKTNAFENYKGTILVVRSPRTGAVATFVWNGGVIDVHQKIENAAGKNLNVFVNGDENYLTSAFGLGEVDFCVNPSGEGVVNNRTEVRLLRGAQNSSGVEIVSFDSERNKCNDL